MKAQTKFSTRIAAILILSNLFGSPVSRADEAFDANARDRATFINAIDYLTSDQNRNHGEDVTTILRIDEMLKYRKMANEAGVPVSADEYLNYGLEIGSILDDSDPDFRSLQRRGTEALLNGGVDILAKAAGKLDKTGALTSVIQNGWKVWREFEMIEFESENNSTYRNEWAGINREATNRLPKIMQEVFDVCRAGDPADDEFCAIASPMIEGHFGVRLYDPAEFMEASVPGGIPEDFPRDEQGRISLNIEELEKTFDKLNKKYADDIVNRIVPFIKKQDQKGVVEESKTQAPTRDEIKKLTDEHERVSKFFNSTFKLASILVSATDSEKGQKLLTAATAQYKIWEAFDKFSITANALAGSKDLLSNFTNTFDLISAVSGAVMTLSSLVKKNKGSPEQRALAKQFAAIREMIQTVRTEMHERFDRVDKALNEMMTTLADNFFKLDVALGIIRGDLAQIQGSILLLHSQLNRLQRYSLEWTQSSAKGNFLDAVDDCLTYLKRTGKDMSQEKFDECERSFYGWAVRDSTDRLWAGPISRDYSDDEIQAAMVEFPLSVNINYFSQFLRQNLKLEELSPNILPNPIEWELGAEAYIDLITAWPELAKATPGLNDRRLTILARGMDLRDALQRIISKKGAEGQNQPSKEVFDALFAKYIQKLTLLDRDLKGLEAQYVADNMKITETNEFLDLWKTADEHRTPWLPSISTLTSPSNTQIAIPDGNLLQLIPSVFLMAGRMKWGNFDMIINNLSWQNDRRPQPYSVVVEAESMSGHGSGPNGPTVSVESNNILTKTVTFPQDGYYRIAAVAALERIITTANGGFSIQLNGNNRYNRGSVPGTAFTENFAGGIQIEKGTYTIEFDATGLKSGYMYLDKIEFRLVHGGPVCVSDGFDADGFDSSRCERNIPSEAVRQGRDHYEYFVFGDPVFADLYYDVVIRYEGTPIVTLRGHFPSVRSLTYFVLGEESSGAAEYSPELADTLIPNWGTADVCNTFSPERRFPTLRYCIGSANLKSTFKNNMTMQATPAEDAIHKSVAGRLNGILQTNRAGLAALTRDKFRSSTVLLAESELLAGIRSLIEGYTVLGLPYTINQRELVRALLYGAERLMGTGELIDFYQTASVESSKRWDPILAATERANLLQDVINKEIDFYGAEDPVDTLPAVADTIRHLEAVAVMLRDVRSLTPNSNRKKFKIRKVLGKKRITKGDKNPFEVTIKYKFQGDSIEAFDNKRALKEALGLKIQSKKGCKLKSKMLSVKGKLPRNIQPDKIVQVTYLVTPGQCAGPIAPTGNKKGSIAISYTLDD